MNQCWPRCLKPFGVTRPHGINLNFLNPPPPSWLIRIQEMEITLFLERTITLSSAAMRYMDFLTVTLQILLPLSAWCRQQMEPFFALLALFAGNSPVTGEFPSQRPVTRSLDVFFDLWQNKRMSKQSWCWWFKMPQRPLWRLCNGLM